MHSITSFFILYNFRTSNRDNELSPELTHIPFVSVGASLSLETQEA